MTKLSLFTKNIQNGNICANDISEISDTELSLQKWGMAGYNAAVIHQAGSTYTRFTEMRYSELGKYVVGKIVGDGKLFRISGLSL